MTVAPLSAAQRTPSAIVESKPSPVLSSTFTGRIRAVQATPAMPTPLLVSAAAIPATIVPWPLSSAALVSLLTKSWPASTRPVRSGCAALTPVSTTATTWDVDPVDRLQAQSAC